MRRTYLLPLLVPCWVAGAMLLAAGEARAWPTVCDNCYQGYNERLGMFDAQCCLDDRCDIWEDQDYEPVLVKMEWCTSWTSEVGPGCSGTQNSCSYDGDGDGGEEPECTVQIGDLCPAECIRCSYIP